MSASGVQYGWMGEESKCGKMSMTASWTVQGLACISVDCCGAGTDAYGVSPADWKPVVSIPSAFQKSMCKTLGPPDWCYQKVVILKQYSLVRHFQVIWRISPRRLQNPNSSSLPLWTHSFEIISLIPPWTPEMRCCFAPNPKATGHLPLDAPPNCEPKLASFLTVSAICFSHRKLTQSQTHGRVGQSPNQSGCSLWSALASESS